MGKEVQGNPNRDGSGAGLLTECRVLADGRFRGSEAPGGYRIGEPHDFGQRQKNFQFLAGN
jgi:hypothetical protein